MLHGPRSVDTLSSMRQLQRTIGQDVRDDENFAHQEFVEAR